MDRRELPPTLKNFVFETIQAAGLDFTEFEWAVVMGPWAHLQVSRIHHPKTGFFFLFDCGSESSDYHPMAWPGKEYGSTSEFYLKQLVKQWVQAVAPEINAPDLWSLAAEQRRLGTDPNQQNTPFTPDEQKQIEHELFRLEEFVYQSEPELTEAKRTAVAARFQYLKGGIARLGRIDWVTLVVGQLFSMAAEQIITVQTFTAAYDVAASMLRKVIAAGSSLGNLISGN